jgi:methionine-S-sulfoxide reductase
MIIIFKRGEIMKNKYSPILIIIMIFGFVWVFLLARVGTERVKGENVMDKKTVAQENNKNTITPDTETAIFAAGCFWGVQEYFSRVKGVMKSESGYSGGAKNNPTYEEVCTGKTGHAESVRITFDPKAVSYERLLQHFWGMHDPTSLNKQGNDIGSQYRSAIFYTNPKQEMEARSSLEKLVKSGRYSKKIVTEILPAKEFYPAEEYHQNYLKKNPHGYCHIDLGKAAAK